MTIENRDTAAAVDERFRRVNLEHPISAMLHELALRREEQRVAGPDFGEDMDYEFPDAETYLDMKREVSLLPMKDLDRRIRLPSLPKVVLELQRALEDGSSSDEIAGILGMDLKLTAAVLSLVNSSLYALPFKVETLSRAVTIIGTREISSLALGARILAMFEDAAIEALPFRRFWKHSVACAVFAHNLATLCGRKDAEKYFTAGLLHDVGRLALFTRYPEMGKVVVALEQKREMPVHAAEVSVFDVDHGVVGALFFTKWGLPRGIVKAALYHHHPGRCLGRDTAEVVFAANQIAAALGFGSNRAYDLPPGEEVWKSLGIGSEDLFSLVDNVDERLCLLLESFEGGAG